ncbi:uncharacterized protein LOC132062988 [Lycium ferocissimum]|uniref:uncharacterized protein LOC132062988 n=1 Tax=Lycium ferocissimum TaxID=112874 RepID=UPI002814ED2B|nr:uncharacterized protein LOC132062988 [Lycium ferocissimum]
MRTIFVIGSVVMFTRSLAPFKRQGIRINVLCPEFVQTDLAEKVNSSTIDQLRGYLPMERVVEGAFELIRDESKAGSCLWITDRRGMSIGQLLQKKQNTSSTLRKHA